MPPYPNHTQRDDAVNIEIATMPSGTKLSNEV
jgi:hypothetical protein